MLQALGYLGVRTNSLDDWAGYATKLLGMQLVDKSASTLALRMDDRKQRLLVNDGGTGLDVIGLEVADAAALDAFAARLEGHRVKVARGDRALAEQRRVRDLIILSDPVGNRIEVFYGAEVASDPFEPGRAISGFRTGPLGMGHIVIKTTRSDALVPFYQDVMGFHLSDYFLQPVKVHFFHLNPRHHSLGIVEGDSEGVHHMMVEVNFLDDVGQGYDIAQLTPDIVRQTLGRHINDHVTSFYSQNPSKFMTEYGWGGRSIDPATWTPKEVTEGPSLWGHERMWLPPEGRVVSRGLRMKAAAEGLRIPVDVQDGAYKIAPGTCRLWDAVSEARKRGYD
jgi:2,3-dihydroxybiphenyl 1,2-dioxygenase